MRIMPLAYGGPSCRTNFGRSLPICAILSVQGYTVPALQNLRFALYRPAFIGKVDVRKV